MISLRWATTLILAAVFSVLAVFGGAASYIGARKESSEFLDLQQRQIARYVGDLTFVAPSEVSLPPHDTEDDYVIEVSYADGRPQRSSNEAIVIPDQPATGFSEFDNAIGHWRVFSLVTPERTVQVAQQTFVRQEIAADAAVRAILPFVVAIPVSWLVVTLVVGRTFRRLERLADDIAGREATDQSPIEMAKVPREILPLITAINDLLWRLKRAMARQREFLSDAAHELRTPLTALTIQIGNIRQAENNSELDARLAELQAGARRASALASQLLRMARYESMDVATEHEMIRLDELAMDVVSGLIPLADQRGVDLGFGAMMTANVTGSNADLRALLEILIDNAVRYTPSGGIVDIAIAEHVGRIELSVSDSGPGVPDDMLPRLTERFFRAHHSNEEGSGLGLAIARTIAQRHDLDLRLSNRQDCQGFRAILSFPPSRDPAGSSA
ncbi:ATP-binding protein [Rhizobium calliandrae]|uniref:histidine kinase n=1 Tax=Rhizobium calliandrae TaxID=1312182 RepID=A0ABT7KM09_9HYPH|nr:ATP-binding protein [Rhizobium calliandrae]MDL2409187.1 ATP-binding protein [Rhizobium calliandrae]